MASKPILILASQSPRRRELLQLMGIPFLQRPADLTEAVKPGETAACYAGRIAGAKARHILDRLQPQDPSWVLAADTVVCLPEDETQILGKPTDRAQAKSMLQRLAGRRHDVLTAISLYGNPPSSDGQLDRLVRTEVRFRRLTEAEIEAYLDTNEWSDKAGAYGIQSAGAFLVDRVSGSFSNVVGLPVEEVWEALRSQKVLETT